jgi:hypothetical protein
MAIGSTTQSQSNINNILGNWTTNLKTIFSQAVTLKTTLDGIGQSGLQNLGFTSGDAVAVINCYNDLNNFNNVYYGNSYIGAGASVNTGAITTNSSGKYGYSFDINVGKAAGLGF